MRGEYSYNLLVTNAELWAQVGQILKAAREAEDWSLAEAGRRAGGDDKPIDGKTIGAIEGGDVGQVDKLEAYARALGRTIADVFAEALERTKKPLSPEGRQFLRKYERISPMVRRALLDLVKEYPDVVDEEGNPVSHPPPPDRSGKDPNTH